MQSAFGLCLQEVKLMDRLSNQVFRVALLTRPVFATSRWLMWGAANTTWNWGISATKLYHSNLLTQSLPLYLRRKVLLPEIRYTLNSCPEMLVLLFKWHVRLVVWKHKLCEWHLQHFLVCVTKPVLLQLLLLKLEELQLLLVLECLKWLHVLK